MLSETIVYYAFRLINLAVLIGLASYIFKKSVRSKIEDAAAEQESYITGLKQQSSALHMKLQEQEHEKEVLRQQASLLKQKIQQWNQAHEREQMDAQKEQEHIARTIIAKLEHQQDYLRTMTLLKESAHQAVEKATEELLDRYSSPEQGKEYLTKLVTYLNEKRHE